MWFVVGVIVGIILTFVFIILTNDVVKEDSYQYYKEKCVLVSVMTAGIVPEYSVVRYYVKGAMPVTGYILRGSGNNMMLVDPFGTHFITLDAEDFVELLATPAATACFYIANKES